MTESDRARERRCSPRSPATETRQTDWRFEVMACVLMAVFVTSVLASGVAFVALLFRVVRWGFGL